MKAAKNASNRTIPLTTHGFRTASSRVCRWVMEMFPISFMPRESNESPADPNTATPASTRYLRKVTVRLSFGWLHGGRGLVLGLFLLNPLVAHGARLQESLGFLVKPLAIANVKRRFP